MPAIEVAFNSAERVKLTGSSTRWATRKPYSSLPDFYEFPRQMSRTLLVTT